MSQAEVQSREIREIVEDVLEPKPPYMKAVMSKFAGVSVAVLVAWDDTNKCYRRVPCDENGKLGG